MTSTRSRYGWQLIGVVAVAFGLMLASIHSAGAATAPTASASRVAKVDIVSFAFKPATLRIVKGDKVNFANTSSVAHTATRDGAFDTGPIKPGKSVSVRFKQKGTFAYHCEIHPQMRGKIVVD